jgi:hypothetical protein
MVFNLRAITATAIVAGLAFAPMAQARDWHGRGGDWHGRGDYHHGGGNAGAAVAAGLIGLGIGAAIASGGGPYYGPPAYYAPPPAVYYGY